MNETKFYYSDSTTEYIANMLNNRRFEDVLQAIRDHRNNGIDTAEFHVWAVIALYELGRKDDVIREGKNSLDYLNGVIQEYGEAVETLSAKAFIIAYVMNAYMDKNCFAEAGSFLPEVLPIISNGTVPELGRSKAAAEAARFYMQTRQEAAGERLIQNFLASCTNDRQFRLSMAENYIKIGNTFLTPVPGYADQFYIDSQEDYDSLIHWHEKAYEICADEAKLHYWKELNAKRALGSADPRLKRWFPRVTVYVCVTWAIRSLLALPEIGFTAVYNALIGIAGIIILAFLAAKKLNVSGRPKWEVIKEKALKANRMNHRNYAPQGRAAEQQRWEDEKKRFMEDEFREAERLRYARAEQQYQTMMAEEARNQRDEAAARAYWEDQDRQRAEYENSFYQNNSYDSYNSYDNYNSYDSYNNYDSYNSYDSSNNYDSY